MLLLDDDDELPVTAGDAESALAAELGEAGVGFIDACILAQTSPVYLKVARIISHALAAGGLLREDDAYIELHARRVMALIDAGRLEVQGNPRKPRWSEVRYRKRTGRA